MVCLFVFVFVFILTIKSFHSCGSGCRNCGGVDGIEWDSSKSSRQAILVMQIKTPMAMAMAMNMTKNKTMTMTMTIMMIDYVDENMTVSMTVTMTKLSWSGDRGEVWADTLENFADALGEAGEVFSWLPFSKIKDRARRQTILSINLCYKWIYHQVAEYAEIAAELAAAALPWQNPHEFCSKKEKTVLCVISGFVSVGVFQCHLRPPKHAWELRNY